MTRTLYLVLFLSFLGCGDESAPEQTSSPAEPEPEPQAPEPDPSEPEPRAGDPASAPERVTFVAEPGLSLIGTLRRGGTPDAPAVILVHQLGSERSEWDPLVAELSEAPGFTTLAFDVRGHGESIERRGRPLHHGSFDTDDWVAVARDVEAAISFLENEEGLSPVQYAVVGSSIGSSAALAAAANDNRLSAVVALSPGRAYRGFDAMTPASELGVPLLLVAAEGELPAAETARTMDSMVGPSELVLVEGGAHGVAMFADSGELPHRIDRFLRERLPSS